MKKLGCYGSLMIFFLAIFCCKAFSQAPPKTQSTKITVTGLVTDTAGKKVEGASVVSQSRRNVGTSTDVNGRFILDVESGSIIVISYVGFIDQKVQVSENYRNLTIVMKLAPAGETVIVTAYGQKQRKEAIVGSVSTINPDQLRTPTSNLTNALAGQVAGMISFQRGGQPGLDNSQFFIRGVTTFGYSPSPLILVDNIELSANDLARLNVDDIASFSILKDASAAALYGARGANGVILVTTKGGKTGKARVNLRYEHSVSKPTQTVELADPVTYMKLFNEAVTTRGVVASSRPLFAPNDIAGTEATWTKAPGYNPYLYPAVDWMSTLFKKQTTTQRANLGLSGGTDFAQYYISGSYDRDNGIMQVNPVNSFNSGMKFENYQLRANVNMKLTKTTEAIVRLWGNFNDYTGPITDDQSGFATDLYDRALHTSPIAFPAYFPPDSANLLTKHILFGNNGNVSAGLQDNPYADLMRGYKSFSESRMSAQFEVNQNLNFITRGLNFRGLFSTNRYSYFDLIRAYGPFYYTIDRYAAAVNRYALIWLNNQPGGGAQEYLSYDPSRNNKNVNTYIYFMGTVDYSRAFGDHNISATLIATREQTQTANAQTLQLSLPHRNLGLAGRLTYSYKSKYFVEGNFGYNGSERFASNRRFGFFPTIGGGWVVSNEDFWQNGNIGNIVTRLKLRGSYGLVGNDNIDKVEDNRFFYLSSVTPHQGPGAYFGTRNSFGLNGPSIQNYPNPDATWETSHKSNLAVEFTLNKNFNVIAEYYWEFRKNIFQRRGYIPVTEGLESNVKANLGTAYAKGLDLHADYKQNFSKDIWVSMLGNLTITSSKYGHVEEPQYKYPYRYQSGQPINQPFGYIAERLFVDDKEAINSPPQTFGGPLPQGGDIKYRDINKDGIINQDDQVPIGLPTTPQIIYGFGVSAGYKGFDINAFFQGLARESFFINPTSQDDRYNGYYGTTPFVNNAQILKAYAENHWSEENQSLYALWPRLSTYDVANNQQASTWWMRDGSFMRLKSLEIGYTFPKNLVRRAFMENLRIYFNGLNLVTWSHFKLWDPEMAGQGFGYPVQKVFNVGINANF
ncbi:MAG: TonB-dependent receptor [Chitinophagaceae bacterium]|nr:TonB-dependent receptor [Chitinophagaceae bacterium]